MYGIWTWSDRMPTGFPVSSAQNSGNMVHSRAPVEMFPNSVTSDVYGFKSDGFNSFIDFVNERCEAVIVPMANTIRLGEDKDARAPGTAKSLSRFKVPIVIFGLGAQAPTTNIDDFELGPGMTELIRFLSENAAAISVRGEFTRQVFEKYGSTDRVFTTGCPSFYSHPEAFQLLKDRLERGVAPRRAAFSGTQHQKRGPQRQLHRALDEDLFLIEPVNAQLHKFYLDCVADEQGATPPPFLASILDREGWDLARLKSYMVRRYRLFRDMDSWLEFNRESVDGTIGTRFHVNMASLLSGVPAKWIVHDSRTQELCQRLSLPHVSEHELGNLPYREHLARANFEPLFASLTDNFNYFNEFLRAGGLPQISVPTVV